MIILHQNKAHLDSMVIGQGHTIMAGFIPKRIEPQQFSENFYKWHKPDKETIEKFGLFGSDLNYNTYYPDLSDEELKPQSEEFIEPMFRLLSATIVSKNWNPTDFSKKGVLKNSMPLLLGQTVNCDHETSVGNAIGSVSQVVWQEAYKDGDFTIPGGINGILKIDGKANPRIARGILMEPPSIHSNSVTVQFRWDKSHPDMDDRDFYGKLGTYDEHGEMIRRIVIEVNRYLETSLVSHGADTFAQKIGDDGKIVNPTFAKRTWSSYKEYEDDKSKQYYFFDFKSDVDSYQESNNTPGNIINNSSENPEDMNKELQEFLMRLFGENMLSLGEGQEASVEMALSMVKNLVSGNKGLETKVANLETEKKSLSEQVTNKDNQIASLTEMATVGKNYITSLRETTVANYKKLMGEDKVDETIVTMLNAETTGLATLISLNKDYSARLEEKFPLHCAKCGSHDISRSSSIQEPVQEPKKEETTENSEVRDTNSVIEDLYHQKMYNN